MKYFMICILKNKLDNNVQTKLILMHNYWI
jgi:hypothetical protein